MTGRGLRIAVTVFLRGGDQSLWENGIHQNCLFLLMLLGAVSSVAQVFVLPLGPGATTQEEVAQDKVVRGEVAGAITAPSIDQRTALDALDIVIELGAQLELDWARQFAARGGRIVAMRVANDFMIDVERLAFGLSPGLLVTGAPYAAIWMLAGFVPDCAGYYAAALRAPVRIMPHLWSPVLVERAAGGHFAYRPGRARWRLEVVEPNICTVKTCHLPLLLADVAHRRDPQAIAHVRIFNALAVRRHPAFVAYARSLDLVRHGLVTFEGRLPLHSIMGAECDAIVAHHDGNPQNYSYYEALYGGFPLIHNSALLGEAGYRYADHDPEDGALALLHAIRGHDADIEGYRSIANRFLATLDPLCPANIAAFERAILDLDPQGNGG